MYPKYIQNVLLISALSPVFLLAEYSEYGYNREYNSGNHGPVRTSVPAKEVIIQNRKTITALKRQLAEQRERIDGLTSIIEGLNASVAELKMNLASSTVNSENDNTALLKELGVMIDKINNNYVSKEELQKALKGNYERSSKVSSTKRKKKSVSSDSMEGKATSQLYSEGVRLFVKKRYSEAKKRFTITDTKGYKPAASNYYLGEIAYYTKKYEDAIFYFKKSVGLYDQASYIDVLLLHTAISLDKTGDKSQARTFYKNIIDNYEGKNSAKIAKQKLKKL
jgi:TolA-binding protein